MLARCFATLALLAVCAASPAAPAHAHQVQARHPGTVTTRFPNAASANQAAAALRRKGWTVKVSHGSRGSVTKARMPRWKAASVWANPAVARNAAASLRTQGFQARVVQVR